MTPLPSWPDQRRLDSHFRDHGREFPYASVRDYEASSLATIRTGVSFRYIDPSTNKPRIGYYDRTKNHFTAVTIDGVAIVTHFRPDRGEQYIRDLPSSTYT